MQPIKVALHYTYAPRGGFGILGNGIARGLQKNPAFKLVYLQGETLSNEAPDIIFTYGMPDLYDEVVKPLKKKYKKAKTLHYFVWESSELPADFIREYKKYDMLLTSTKYIQKCAAKQGLKSMVWHHALDDRFSYRPRKNDGIFTFLHHNAYEFRKGWEYILEAFTNEFKPDEPVQLVLKARERKQSVWLLPKEKPATPEVTKWRRDHRDEYLKSFSLDIPNVKEIIGHVDDQTMVDINDSADCFLFPAKGEGWGLPPFEAAGMGIIPILPNAGSFAEYFMVDLMIDVKTNGWLYTAPRYPGYMQSISVRDLAKRMREVYEFAKNNPDEYALIGETLSRKVHYKYNWDTVINELLDILNVNSLVK